MAAVADAMTTGMTTAAAAAAAATAARRVGATAAAAAAPARRAATPGAPLAGEAGGLLRDPHSRLRGACNVACWLWRGLWYVRACHI